MTGAALSAIIVACIAAAIILGYKTGINTGLFYNFAAINGTLEKLSGTLLYTCRKFPGLLPFALFAVAVLLSIMGATFFTVMAFMTPITLAICEEAHMDKLTGGIAINCGALAGGNFPTSNLGVIFRGLADSAYEANKNLQAVESFSDDCAAGLPDTEEHSPSEQNYSGT